MPRLFTCPQGHQWRLPVDASSAENDITYVCPVCGTVSNSSVDADMLEAEPLSADSTVSNPGYIPSRAAPSFKFAAPKIPGYQMLGEIGRGGMGVVYKAWQHAYERIVAIKVIRNDRLFHDEAVRRFRREAQAAARLSHPNVVLVYDSDMEGDLHYLVMEYVDGVTLQDLVDAQGPLPEGQACEYIRQAALGLQHVCEQALVHRDIKPSNIMIRSAHAGRKHRQDWSGDLIKILDLGVVRLYQLGESPVEIITSLTQPGAVIGTADFIAPEQLENPKDADTRADLYSLGCAFYYLLTGQVPFPGGTLIQKLDRQRWKTPVAVETLREDVPAGVAAVVRKLMAKNPDERYPSPAELLADLQALRRGSNISTALRPAPIRATRCLTGHDDVVWSAAFSPDGQIAVSAGKDQTLRLWEVESGRQLRILAEQPKEFRSVAFSPDGTRVASASGVSVRVWNVSDGKVTLRLIGHSDTVREVKFSPGGGHIVSCGDDRTVRVWDAGTGRELLRFARHRGGVHSIAVSSDGKLVFSGGRDNTLRFWSIRNGQEVRSFKTAHGQVMSVALSSNGLYALSAHFDTVLRLWDLGAGRELRQLQGHKQMITSAVFTSDDKRLLSGSKDQTIRLWDVDTGGEVCRFAGHEGGVTCVSISPCGRFAISAGMDRTLRLWRLPEIT